MLSQATVSKATDYWASYLGCLPDVLFSTPLRIVAHGSELSDYNGALAMTRGMGTVISIPDGRPNLREVLSSLAAPEFTSLADALRPFYSKIIGPAYIGYTDVVAAPVHEAVVLQSSHRDALDELRRSCTAEEWEHGGCDIATHPASGIFFGDELIAIAGYEIWGGTIAHIAVVTSPRFRGCGYGRSVVAHLAAQALGAGLIPQYRTLETNLPSMRIAEDVGFARYAASLAFRF